MDHTQISPWDDPFCTDNLCTRVPAYSDAPSTADDDAPLRLKLCQELEVP